MNKIFLILLLLISNVNLSKAQLIDIDGNVYITKRIGVQKIRHLHSIDSFLIWTTTNLNVSKFKNGDLIKEAKTDEEWNDALDNGIPAWCYLDNDPSNGKILGKLYNYYAVINLKGLAPEGWHIADDYDWEIVFKTYQVKITEANSYEDWKIFMSPKWNNKYGWSGNNKTGFNALPSGYRAPYGFSKDGAYYWGDTSLNRQNGPFRQIRGDMYMCDNGCEITYRFGFSVRCVKDW